MFEKLMMKNLAFFACVSFFIAALGQNEAGLNMKNLPDGYWPLQKSEPIVEKTQTILLAPDLSGLSSAERSAVTKLLEAGKIFQTLYESQLHRSSIVSHQKLLELEKRNAEEATQNLLTLYRLFQGPIATTLENKREPFLPVDPPAPGRNVYPWGVTSEQIESFLQANTEKRAAILDLRTVVRQATPENVKEDIARLKKYPALELFHPKFRTDLESMDSGTTQKYYAVPYSIAYADELIKVHSLLNEAAESIQAEDEEFARYLRNRARDLLTNDYESGDASWITGRFQKLNAEIGSYETYDDELFGVKTFFAFSLLVRRDKETIALQQALKGLQELEESLPYDSHKRINEDIPVGVYDVIADFGQARGGNTATILPNESYLARRYGRTILLRANIMRNPNLFERSSGVFAAAVGKDAAQDLNNDGNFYRTLWHEIGHYLGVDRTKDNRTLDEALQDSANAIEEMKSDLVSLYVAQSLHKQGYYTDELLRSVYASGILRVLQNNPPRRDQPYNTMQLMQWNYFLENGLLTFDGDRLSIHYDKYHDVVKSMLAKTLAVQYAGNKAEADGFIDQYTKWDESLHGVIAKKIRDQQRYRFSLFRYAALGES